MRRIRQGVATEAYWASTVRERNEAGADAAALECNRIYELKHKGRMIARPVASDRLDDPPGLDARGAGVDVTHRTALDRLHPLDIRLPHPRGAVVGVGDVVPETGGF